MTLNDYNLNLIDIEKQNTVDNKADKTSWVITDYELMSSGTLYGQNTITFDLSDYLPDDNIYEVNIKVIGTFPIKTAGAFSSLYISTDIMTSPYGYCAVRLKNAIAGTNGAMFGISLNVIASQSITFLNSGTSGNYLDELAIAFMAYRKVE